MGINDIITHYILGELENEDGSTVLSRSELAERFKCVPSQINYVLMTRFSPEHGYTVESRRGGGGYIRITRVNMTRGMLIMHVINSIGDSIDARSAAAFLANMRAAEAIDGRETAVISAAISDSALTPVQDRELRDRLRASVLKRCLMQIAN